MLIEARAANCQQRFQHESSSFILVLSSRAQIPQPTEADTRRPMTAGLEQRERPRESNVGRSGAQRPAPSVWVRVHAWKPQITNGQSEKAKGGRTGAMR